MTVGERIRQTRIDKEMSQTELASRAHYSDKTRISKIENSGNDISMKQVRRIADALGVTSAYLMGWEDINGDYTVHGQLLDAYIQRDKAAELYSVYKNLSPEKQAAFEAYLKFLQSQS